MRNPLLMPLLSLCGVCWVFGAGDVPKKPHSDAADIPIPAGVKAFKDLEYGNVGDQKLLLDLYVPEKQEGKVPVIVWVHGGGWLGGSKKDCLALKDGFVQKGFAVASVDYRLTKAAIFPAQIEDCKSAIRWLRANADTYNLDAAHFGAWGSSAGGHLVALLGTTGDSKTFDQGENLRFSSAVQAVCDYYGPTDFASFVTAPGFETHATSGSAESKLIGGRVLDNPEKAKRASATTYVSKGNAPFLIIHGDKDPVVPVAQSKMFDEMLTKAGVETEFHTISGAKHGGPEFSSPAIIAKVEAFFKKHLLDLAREKKSKE
ncbi:MAG: alpha/beta hydrolase [bacterium]